MVLKSGAWDQAASRAVLPWKALGKNLSLPLPAFLPILDAPRLVASSLQRLPRPHVVERASFHVSSKAKNPILLLHLIISQRLHPKISSHWGLGLGHVNFGGHSPSVSNRQVVKLKKNQNTAFVTNKSWSRPVLLICDPLGQMWFCNSTSFRFRAEMVHTLFVTNML